MGRFCYLGDTFSSYGRAFEAVSAIIDDVILQDTDLQIREVMALEIEGTRRKGSPRKSLEKLTKNDLVQFGLKQEDAEGHER